MTRRKAETMIRRIAQWDQWAAHSNVIRFCETCERCIGCLHQTQTATHNECGGTLILMRKAPAAWVKATAERALAWAAKREIPV